MNKNFYKELIKISSFLDSTLWQFVFMYTMLHIARSISDEDRAIVGMIESAIGFVSMWLLQQRKLLKKATRYLGVFQFLDMIASIATRFLVISHPASYSAITAIRNAISFRVTASVFNRLENLLFIKEERTRLNLAIDKMRLGGSFIGSGIAFCITGISITSICWFAVGFCLVSYVYEIVLGFYLRKLVIDIRLKRTNL